MQHDSHQKTLNFLCFITIYPKYTIFIGIIFTGIKYLPTAEAHWQRIGVLAQRVQVRVSNADIKDNSRYKSYPLVLIIRNLFSVLCSSVGLLFPAN